MRQIHLINGKTRDDISIKICYFLDKLLVLPRKETTVVHVLISDRVYCNLCFMSLLITADSGF